MSEYIGMYFSFKSNIKIPCAKINANTATEARNKYVDYLMRNKYIDNVDDNLIYLLNLACVEVI